ncbi:radical SAM family heme chaperone HemW [Neofamilia massiliensis]|uniref:radical SAM family heme chaperone HemW n=1 Tax=Neofamilia massiliensis TaxID=1673724 RepID=UPI0006BB56C0|nr:radical SAM family heme chaperone HemW [Neofamilia massiliensis]
MKSKLGLYIHIPFCQQKCNYCDFNSFKSSASERSIYIDALIKEIFMQGPSYKDYLVDSIFIGGGTPSILDEREIIRISKALEDNFSIASDLEFTIELNPNSVNLEKFKAYKEAGINRLSFGGQSFNDKELKDLGRIHQASDIFTAIKLAKSIGFKNISLDLMLGIPGQSLESLKDSLKKAMSLDLKHLSVYSLILEAGTNLYDMATRTNKLNLPDETLERDMYHFTKNFLKDFGFYQYEISNFSKEGFESRHNLKYWSFEDYLGLGLSSSSKIGNKRFANVDGFSSYIKALENNLLPVKEKEVLTRQDQINEYIFMGLRKTVGFSYKKLEEIFSLDFLSVYENEIEKNLNLGLIDVDDNYLRLTEKGLDLANQVEIDFYRL